MRRCGLLFLVAALCFSPAVLASAADWTGFYIGGQMMHGWGHTDWKYQLGNTASHDTRGWAGGPLAGYNYQFANNIVVGAETDYSFGKIDGSTPCPNPAFSCTSEVTKLGTTRIRAGYAFGPLMPYVTAGMLYAQAKIATHIAGANFGSDENYFGWTAGAGLEYAITDNFIARVGYAYDDLRRNRSKVDNNLVVINHPKINAVKFGVLFKF